MERGEAYSLFDTTVDPSNNVTQHVSCFYFKYGKVPVKEDQKY
jgi:hypothetical protein